LCRGRRFRRQWCHQVEHGRRRQPVLRYLGPAPVERLPVALGHIDALRRDETRVERAGRAVIDEALNVRNDGFDSGNFPPCLFGEEALHIHDDMHCVAAQWREPAHGCTTTLWSGVHSRWTVVPGVSEGAPLFCSKTVTSRPCTSTL